jgi:chromosome segregation protein
MQPILKELVIENFMSYKYARIRFGPGLNLIIGPNGAGKSSILLALSVALGQTYTERARRLGELVRWGEEYGRVTVRLDNRRIGGRRPIPRINRDEVVITRYLSRKGYYSFELNHREITKAELTLLLGEAGLNPDNSLIIMHQNMIELFSVVDAREKLLMFEEALGLKSYRDNILAAKERLERVRRRRSHSRRYSRRLVAHWRDTGRSILGFRRRGSFRQDTTTY